jgi:dipeptidyl aminopeptidase/acylaminoacyl peptidase
MKAPHVCLFLLLLGGVACTPSNVPPPRPTPTPLVPDTVAGLRYDKAIPLQATEKPQFDPKKPPKLRTYAVTYISMEKATVPGNLMLPQSAKPVPAVLLLHGLGGSKADMQLLQMLLAGKGYASLAIDIAGHGVRPKIGGKGIADIPTKDIATVVAQTAQDLRRATDYLATRKEIDPKRIGFTGVSLGGIIGGVFLGSEPRIKCGALWAAGGRWGTLLTTSKHPFAKKHREAYKGDAAKIQEELAAVDPANWLGKFKGPLYFLHGDQDEIVPPECTGALLAVTEGNPNIANLVLHGGHVPDVAGMTGQTIRFFDKFLK